MPQQSGPAHVAFVAEPALEMIRIIRGSRRPKVRARRSDSFHIHNNSPPNAGAKLPASDSVSWILP